MSKQIYWCLLKPEQAKVGAKLGITVIKDAIDAIGVFDNNIRPISHLVLVSCTEPIPDNEKRAYRHVTVENVLSQENTELTLHDFQQWCIWHGKGENGQPVRVIDREDEWKPVSVIAELACANLASDAAINALNAVKNTLSLLGDSVNVSPDAHRELLIAIWNQAYKTIREKQRETLTRIAFGYLAKEKTDHEPARP